VEAGPFAKRQKQLVTSDAIVVEKTRKEKKRRSQIFRGEEITACCLRESLPPPIEKGGRDLKEMKGSMPKRFEKTPSERQRKKKNST